MIGIDTPETVDPRRPVECFGKEASAKTKELLFNKEVRLEKDVSETDKYGRLLRYVYVGDIFINEQLVLEGYAEASAYPPNIAYQAQLEQAEKQAQEQRTGLWSPDSCPIQ
jgi:micrococcal nuclease